MKWRPDKVILQIAVRQQKRVAQAILASAPRVPHRGNSLLRSTESADPIGGSLSKRVLAKSVLVAKRWGVVLQWSTIGQTLQLFAEGTTRQKPRPLPFLPSVAEVRSAVERDAERYWRRRAERAS